MPDPIPAPAPAAAPAPGSNPQVDVPGSDGAPVIPAAAPVPPPAADPAAPKPAATVLSDPPPADPNAPPAEPKAGEWPTDWRERASQGADGKVDDKVLQRLKRYASPKAGLEALIHAQNRIAKGEVQKVLGENPTPEEVAEYRKANDIPEKPDGYKIELADGRVIGEVDKPIIAKIAERLHSSHATPAQVNNAANIYFEVQESLIQQRQDADIDDKVRVEDALRLEYGTEYRGNVNALRNYLESMPGSIGAKLAGARFSDGTLAFNDPDVLRYFTQQAVEANPAATVAPGSSANPAASLATEIDQLKVEMSDPQSAYWKGPLAEKKQKRYQELRSVEERMKTRAA